ncbi:hypothetical protein BJ912DRAFT_929365 [Pholiota molesta]|nr:hypothetical protein BJ912DRAFT_929365 [Pholiota molesta]
MEVSVKVHGLGLGAWQAAALAKSHGRHKTVTIFYGLGIYENKKKIQGANTMDNKEAHRRDQEERTNERTKSEQRTVVGNVGRRDTEDTIPVHTQGKAKAPVFTPIHSQRQAGEGGSKRSLLK